MMSYRLIEWICLCLLGAFCLDAFAGQPRQGELPAEASARFASLAQQQPRQCGATSGDLTTPAGWQVAGVQCAWRDLLRVRYFALAPQDLAAPCISHQAAWWSWARQTLDPVPVKSWYRSWTNNALVGQKAGALRLLAISGSDAGGWTGVEWSWSPSARPATRQWQQGRWQLIVASAKAGQAAVPLPGIGGEWIAAAWERHLGGRAGEVTANALRWESAGLCLSLQTVAPTELPFPMPYNRADVRLEQLSAMQVQLARRHPDARWLVPFRLLDDGTSSMSGGAKYEAIWGEKTDVVGQLWVPSKTKGAILRVRVTATPVGARAPAASVGDSLQGELQGLARLLGEWHDR